MKNDNFIDFGEEVSRTVRKVLNNQEFYDLKNMINRTMQNVPGMGGSVFGDPYFDGKFPRLSKDENPTYGNGGDRRPRRHRGRNGASLVLSTLLLVFGSIGAASAGLLMLLGISFEASIGNMSAVTSIAAVSSGPFLISLILIFSGAFLRKRTKRFRLYQKVLNGRTFCTVEELEAASGQGAKYIVKDLRKMIQAGLFPEGYLDEKETCLMTDYQTYAQYLDSMKSARERQEAERREMEKWASREGGVQLKEAIDEGKNYVRTIKAANDALPEEEISEKLDQLELVTTKIFDYVEQHPEKLQEIRKFMCYYMPITLKLVNAYQKFDQHGTSEVEATKLEIKGTLDTINKAYYNLLNKLMQTDILDVSSDISALETILAQEGLTEDNFQK